MPLSLPSVATPTGAVAKKPDGFPPSEVAEPAPRSALGRVLVVDDNADIRDSLRILLEGLSDGRLQVDVAADGALALALFARGEHYDLVITDERMPHLRGLELLAYLREHHPEVRRVLMTALAAEDLDPEECARAGAAEVLHKPFSIEGDEPWLPAVLPR